MGAFPPVDFWAVCLHRAMVMMIDDGVWNCVCCWQGHMGGREVFVHTSIRHSIQVPTCTLPSALFIKSDFLFA